MGSSEHGDISFLGLTAEGKSEFKIVDRLKDIEAYLEKHLAGFKVPKGFIIVDGLPKNPAGKLRKREIKKQYT